MARYALTLVPCTMSPLLRDMHRQTREFDAASDRDARALVAKGFPGGADLSGEWFVETLKPAGE